MKNVLRNILKNRLALSTVITTLIILVVSVLLAGVVTYFAINVVSTRVQQESLTISYAHIWVPASGDAVGALMITNTGGRDVVINQIQIRGQPVFGTGSAALVYNYTGVTAGTDLAYGTLSSAGNSTYVKTSGPLVLSSGNTIGIYIDKPDSVTTNDIGLTIAFTVFTAEAVYYQETNVQAS
jgi:hypothetical protein